MANHLADETSPYLLQHAHNPVDWYPWGEQALAKARAEDKPIFLSIGYSACHWCHVMAHESFEDENVAGLLNKHFVSIKVDREERPDLDQVYMSAVQAMSGTGGWPMSVFITPDGHPFYGGTYFPPIPRYGMPSFTDVLHAIIDAWQNQRQEIFAGGRRVVEAIEHQAAAEAGGADLDPEIVESAFRGLRQSCDQAHGGWGNAPKFPQPMALEFLLRYNHVTRNPQALRIATHTLEAMARGGVYDQVGGGFHRYSVDSRWLTPHFEKMLYDQAQLARVYLHGWQVTGTPLYCDVACEVLDYVAREMADPAGGFYSTQDADSEGDEGKFFLWTPSEIRDVLGDDAEAFIQAYGVTEQGNFEDRNILEFTGDVGQRPALAEARRKLYEVRERRVHPGRDEKVLTSWNGLMLAAFSEAARVLDRDDYRQAAQRNADFLLRELRRPDGRLLHSWKRSPEPSEGAGEARINGYLEDYAYLADGLIELYQATFDPRYVLAARELADTVIAHFSAPDGGFFDTSNDHEKLITRPRDVQDNATPSGGAMAATALLRLAGLVDNPDYVNVARRALAQVQPLIARYPLGFGQWLIALDYAMAHPCDIAIVGRPGAPDTLALFEAAAGTYRPHQVVAFGPPDGNTPAVPLLENRGQVDGRATAYVCVDFACRPPVTTAEELRALTAR